MALPQSLLTAVEQHACFAGCYSGRDEPLLCLDGQAPLQPAVVIACQDCLSFKLSVLSSLLPAGMTSHRLAKEITRYAQQQRGVSLATSGYHVEGPGFWFHAAYYDSCGLFLLDGRSSRQLGSDLDLLMLAFQHQVLTMPDVRMFDPNNYSVQQIYLDTTSPLPKISNINDLLSAPEVSLRRPSGGRWRKATLAEFLLASSPVPVAQPVIVQLPDDDPEPSPVDLEPGDVCPVCNAEVKERQLLTGSFVGCLC